MSKADELRQIANEMTIEEHPHTAPKISRAADAMDQMAAALKEVHRKENAKYAMWDGDERIRALAMRCNMFTALATLAVCIVGGALLFRVADPEGLIVTEWRKASRRDWLGAIVAFGAIGVLCAVMWVVTP